MIFLKRTFNVDSSSAVSVIVNSEFQLHFKYGTIERSKQRQNFI